MDKTHTMAHETNAVTHKIGTAFFGLGYAVFMLASLAWTLLRFSAKVAFALLLIAALLHVL